MKLILDLQSAQGQSRLRGIGRQSMGFARALMAGSRDHEVWVAVSSRFPDQVAPLWEAFGGILPEDRRVVLNLPGPVAWNTPGSASTRARAEWEREAQLAALRPDVVHVGSLFEGFGDESVTDLKPEAGGYAATVTLHDLMPLIHPGSFCTEPAERVWYEYKLERLRTADLLLAVSESSREEALRHLGLDAERVVTVSAAADARFRARDYQDGEIRHLCVLYGLEKPFVMFSGGDSHQKNIEGLLRAFASLPQTVRRAHQLLIACGIAPERRARLRRLCAGLGLGGNEVCFSGFIPDEHLVAFYNRCRVFVFPSWHEGFGLPVLEAMSCGAPVIGSNCTSLPEVIGRPDALFDPHCTESITSKLHEVLTDAGLREDLARYGRVRSREFRWEKSAARAWDAFEALQERKSGAARRTRVTFADTVPDEDHGRLPSRIRPPRVEPGLCYGMDGPNSLLPFLGRGWSYPEAWGIWSEDEESTLWFQVPEAGSGPRALELDVRATRGWARPFLLLHVRVDGRRVITRVLWGIHRLCIPLPESAEGGIHHLRITVVNPSRPWATLGARDLRRLGMGLTGLRLVCG
jgi:glycosyltransferase involved in cell wall biosynthesis